MSYIIQRMLRKGRCCISIQSRPRALLRNPKALATRMISIVLAFSFGRAKTIGMRVFFRKRKKKISGFKNIGIRVELA